MTVTLIDAASGAENAVFRQKATAAAVRYAGTIADQILAVEEPTAIEKSRLLLAQAVIAAPTAHTERVAYLLACYGNPDDELNPDVEGDSTDEQFVAAVEANWDLFATLLV